MSSLEAMRQRYHAILEHDRKRAQDLAHLEKIHRKMRHEVRMHRWRLNFIWCMVGLGFLGLAFVVTAIMHEL